MKLKLASLVTFLCAISLLGTCANAQMTQVTASTLKIGSTPVGSGTVCAVAVDNTDNPIPVAIGGGGIMGQGQSCANVSAGAIGTALGGGAFVVPDVALAGNPGFLYDFVITDNGTKQSFSLHQVPNIKGATWALDHYFPTITVPTLSAFTFTTGSGAPSGVCSTKSLYQDISVTVAPVLYQCGADGAFHVVTGTGNAAIGAGQANQDAFYPSAGSAIAADTKATSDGFGNKKMASIASFNPFAPLLESGAITRMASNYQQCGADGGSCNGLGTTWVDTYYQTQRTPGGGDITLHTLNFNILSGYENTLSYFPDAGAQQIFGLRTTSIQMGGLLSHQYIATAPGDDIYMAKLHLCWGMSRETDEACKPDGRWFAAFTNANFGGHLTLGTKFADNDQPMTIAPFGGYSVQFPGEHNILLDISKKTAVGNATSMAAVNSRFIQITHDATSTFSASTVATLTADVDSQVYTGSCPSTTATGQTYPTIGVNAGKNDAFSTPVNGIGLPQINGNYQNTVGGTLVGACAKITTVTTSPAAGTLVCVASDTFDFETVTVIASGTNFFTANFHQAHSSGSTVAWGGGCGYAEGSGADTNVAGTLGTTQNPQNAALQMAYPIIYTIDAHNDVVWVNSEATVNTPEFKTRGFNSNVPLIPMVTTVSVSGGTATSIAQLDSNYLSSIQIGGNIVLPAPTLNVADCSVQPTYSWKIVRGDNHFAYFPTIVTGGTCAGSGSFPVTATNVANPFFVFPATQIYRVLDPVCTITLTNNCIDGYTLTTPINSAWVNGDEVAMGQWWQQFMGNTKQTISSPSTINSGRAGPQDQEAFGWVLNNQAKEIQTDATPTIAYYGSFPTWQPDPTVPWSGGKNPGPLHECAGIQCGYLWDTPPTLGLTNIGSYPYMTGTPGAPQLGDYAFKVGCVLVNVFAVNGQSSDDHPCVHGQLHGYGIWLDKNSGAGFWLDPYTGSFHVTTTFSSPLATPVSSTSFCTVGQFEDDANFHYVCTGPSQWKRAALTSF